MPILSPAPESVPFDEIAAARRPARVHWRELTPPCSGAKADRSDLEMRARPCVPLRFRHLTS